MQRQTNTLTDEKFKDYFWKYTSESCKHALGVYFHPIKAIKELENVAVEPVKMDYNYRFSAVKNFCCFNQGSMAQYFYVASEYHKDLKEYLNNKKVDKSRVKELTNKLIDYLNSKFDEYTHHNFELIQAYFAGRDDNSPRVCLKGNFKRDRSGESIISVFRNTEVPYISDCAIEKNTGFLHIKKTGKHFLCNDIPKAVAVGEYENPRILKHKAVAYGKERFSNRILRWFTKEEHISHWATCWEDYGQNQDVSSFYKSTLIIPLTLVNNALDDDFKLRMPNADKLIFGFLCLDHVKENYFEESDVATGYIFADMMSMYLFIRMLFTDVSKTFGSVEEYLSSERREFWIKHMDSFMFKRNQKADQLETETDTFNYLFDLDECLLQYISK